MITSPHNPKIKHLRDCLSNAKYRKKTQNYVLESPTIILEALKETSDDCIEIFVSSESHEILSSSGVDGVAMTLVSDTLLSSLSQLKSSHGILALMKFPNSLPVVNGSSLLFLDGVQIPSNLGAIIRNAVAFGCGGLYMSHHTCDPLSPEAIRASAGHYRHLPMITASLRDVKKHHPAYRLYKMDGHGDTSLNTHLFDTPSIFVIGSESGFCKETEQELANVPSICIPIHTRVDSLNVSVATGILLYSMSCYTEKNRD